MPTAATSVARRSDRKRNKRTLDRADSDSDDDSIGKAIKKMATEENQMARVMEKMQESQTQQLQLMTQLLGTFSTYMQVKKDKKD